jgi:hypothetical protein
MKPLLDSSYFGQITTDNQVATLEAYWEGIRRSIPDAFVEPRPCTWYCPRYLR